MCISGYKFPHMNNRSILFACLCLLSASLALGEDRNVAGPKGGRLLATEPHATEFFVTADRKVEITFYDAALKPVPSGTQIVSVTAETPAGPVAIPLATNGDALISSQPLPAGEAYRVVVQVRAATGAKPKNFRLDLNLATCGGCQHAEYACTCAEH
jgi:hypothetical protein